MKQINARELGQLTTLITNFMNDNSPHFKKYEELVKIFETNYSLLQSDPSNDLRILKFSEDMENGKWNQDITISSQNNIVIDGIHRGIAYLRCIQKGVNEEKLPRVFLVQP